MCPRHFSLGHRAHPDGAYQLSGIGYADAGITNSLKIALGDLPQLFLPGLNSYRVNKGLDLIGISINKEVCRRDDGNQITRLLKT